MEARNQRLMILIMGGLTLVSIGFVGVQDIRMNREPTTMSNIASAGFGALAAAWQTQKNTGPNTTTPPDEPKAVITEPVEAKKPEEEDESGDRPDGVDPTEGKT